MPALKTEIRLREFYFNGVRIPDPGPDLTATRSGVARITRSTRRSGFDG